MVSANVRRCRNVETIDLRRPGSSDRMSPRMYGVAAIMYGVAAYILK